MNLGPTLPTFVVLLVSWGAGRLGGVLGMPRDWILSSPADHQDVQVLQDRRQGHVTITNGLVSRTFCTSPGFATLDFYSHEKNSSLLRALNPEGKLSLDGVLYNIGGIRTGISRAYLNRSALAGDAGSDPDSFQYLEFSVNDPEAPFPYRPKRRAPRTIVWPPRGKRVDFKFRAPVQAPQSHQSLRVTVSYEVYSGVPLITKWISVESNDIPAANDGVNVSIVSVETLAVNQQWASGYGGGGADWLDCLVDEPHNGVAKWSRETLGAEAGSFQTQVEFAYGSNFTVVLGGQGSGQRSRTAVRSFKAMELVSCAEDKERSGLAKQRVKRLLAPQTMETPLYFHAIHSDSASFRNAVDQLHQVGFDMIFYSFGSGFDLEAVAGDPKRLQQLKEDVAYANALGVEVGGYDLICWTRKVKDEWAALVKHSQGFEGACFASGWYDHLLSQVLRVVEEANMTAIETDGPYPGYDCASTSHAHHRGLDDSIYRQQELQEQFFLELRKREVFINQPDEYFYFGGNKEGLGYDEGQYSLPRWMDLLISRQGLFDDTFSRTPTEGWMFVPISEYHGGGAEATFQPLHLHLKEYNMALAQYFGAGVQACYRGDAIFDAESTKAVVKKWADFYKKYHGILTGNLIHVRRADMQSIDAFMHVPDFLFRSSSDHPSTEAVGLAFFFNPIQQPIRSHIRLPLYYTGLTEFATLIFEDDPDTKAVHRLERDYSITIPVELGPESVTWAVIT